MRLVLVLYEALSVFFNLLTNQGMLFFGLLAQLVIFRLNILVSILLILVEFRLGLGLVVKFRNWVSFLLIVEVVRSVSISKIRGLFLVFLYIRGLIVIVVADLLLLGPFLGSFHDLLIFKELFSGKLLQFFFLSFFLELLVLDFSYFLSLFEVLLLLFVLVHKLCLLFSVPVISLLIFLESSLDLFRHFAIFLILSLDFSLLLLFSSLFL